MELEQARKRAAELRAVIEKNNRLYYDQDAPELEDYEYDQLTRELKTIEAQFPQLVTPDSPTQHVGGTPSGKFSKVAHAVKMESLQDAFSLDELREFDQRVREAGVTPEYVVEIKIDGLSVSLEYRNGRLTRGSTRGDGLVGEDVTENLATIKSIPKEIPNAPDFLEVRGEVYMPHEAYFALKEQQELEDKTPFKNPRNAAAGSMRQTDPRVAASRSLDIVCFNLQYSSGGGYEYHSQTLDAMGVRHVGAVNGRQAWEELTRVAARAEASGRKVADFVSLVLTDVEMPEMDGFMLTRQIKADRRFAGIPVIMHSSLSGSSNHQLGLSVGVDEYVSKFEPQRLSQVLARLLGMADAESGR